MLKKIASAAALMAVGGIACAQSSVTVYGIVDTAVEYMNNVGPSKTSLTRMPSLTGSVPSRLGFRGREDLGGGLSVGFTLEMGLAPDSGVFNQGGRGFGRQSFVSMSGPWGTVGLGRQYTMLGGAMQDADVIGPSLHSMASLDNYFPNARADNALSYRGTFSGFTVGATYSFGRDAVNAGPSPSGTNCAGENGANKSACREWSLLAKYDASMWGVALAHDQLNGGPGAFAGLTSSDKHDKRTMVSAYAKVAGAKIGGGYMRRKNDGYVPSPRSDLWYLGATYPIGQVTLDAQYSRLSYKDNSDKGQLMVMRGTYNFSKRTAAYASLSYMKNSGNAAFGASSAQAGGTPMPGVNQTGFGVGLRHSF